MSKRLLQLLLAAAVVLGLGVWIGSRSSDTAPAVEQQTNLTIRSATPEGNDLGSACPVLSLEDVRKFMKTPDLENVDTTTIYTGSTYNCLYRNMGTALVGVNAYNETGDVFTSSRIQLAKLYEKNKNQKIYKRATVSDMSSVNTVPNTQVFYVHSAKYGHDLMFVNNGNVTIRLRISPFDEGRALDLVGVVADNMDGLQSVTDLDKLHG